MDLEDALLEPLAEAKVPIYMKLDSDLYLELRKRAKGGGGNGKYQVLINEILRNALFGHPQAKKNDLSDLYRRLEKLEEAQGFPMKRKTSKKAI